MKTKPERWKGIWSV